MTRFLRAAAVVLVAASCGGGGDGTPPITVASVAIVPPAAPLVFSTLGRSVQLAAQALASGGAPIPGAAITWSSSDGAVATVNGAGLVTAAGNGTAQITAASGGQTSAPVSVTVSQVPQMITITPTPVVFGALGSTRQLSAQLVDSGGATVSSNAPVWSVSNNGTVSVSATGLVTALAVGQPGAADSVGATITAGSVAFHTARPVIVTQVVAAVVITAVTPGPDTLFTTGRTRQFAAAPRDSNGNLMNNAVTWGQNGAAAVSVNATGLATAQTDGTTNVTALAGAVLGSRAVTVRRFAAVFSLSPSGAAINTAGGTADFTAVAMDSVGTVLPTSWTSRNPAIMTVLPGVGPSATVTAVSNGSVRLVMAGGARSDSALITITNQPFVSFAGQVQPIFTTNCALVGCHNVPGGAGNMNLSAGAAFAQIVNVAANGFPNAIRVIPGNAAASYLIRKLEGGPGISGSRMPDGALPLPAATVQIIKDWIGQGANNN